MVLSQLMAGVMCIGAAFAEEDWLQTTLSLAGKFGASAAFAIMIVQAAELYPTSLRATGLGMAASAGKIGGIAAPIMAGLNPISLPLTVMGVSGLLGRIIIIQCQQNYRDILY